MTVPQCEVPVEAAQAFSIVQRCLGVSLIAAYLHGSAVGGGLRKSSDVDLIAIIDRPVTVETRQRLVVELMCVSGRYPVGPLGRRPVELIVFQQADLAISTYPARAEFVYGEWLRDNFEAGEQSAPIGDPEFTLMLAQAREEARPLVGPRISEFLPAVPQGEIRLAIADALPTLLDGLDGDERNVLLTLTRMWRTLTLGDFVSKDVAAEWAMQHLTPMSGAVVADARNTYLGLKADMSRAHQREVRHAVDELSARVRAML